MSRLEGLERDFQGYVFLHGSHMAGQVLGTVTADAAMRLEVYADAYRLRLLEVLGNDFPGLGQLAGEEKFERLGRAYIESRPSTHFNVRWYGDALAVFLRDNSPWDDESALAEMAAFEWAMGLTFDAPDEPKLTVEQVTVVPPEHWPVMVPVPQSGLQLLELSWNVTAIRRAVDQNSVVPSLERNQLPLRWMVWRRDLTVYFRQMEADEAWAIGRLREGASFSEICEGLCEWHEAETVATHAAGLLKRWVTDGLIREIRLND